MMGRLKKIGKALLTAIVLFVVVGVLSAVAVGAIGDNLASSYFVGAACITVILYAMMLPRMNERGDWHLGKRILFFVWLFISLCGLEMLYVFFGA